MLTVGEFLRKEAEKYERIRVHLPTLRAGLPNLTHFYPVFVRENDCSIIITDERRNDTVVVVKDEGDWGVVKATPLCSYAANLVVTEGTITLGFGSTGGVDTAVVDVLLSAARPPLNRVITVPLPEPAVSTSATLLPPYCPECPSCHTGWYVVPAIFVSRYKEQLEELKTVYEYLREWRGKPAPSESASVFARNFLLACGAAHKLLTEGMIRHFAQKMGGVFRETNGGRLEVIFRRHGGERSLLFLPLTVFSPNAPKGLYTLDVFLFLEVRPIFSDFVENKYAAVANEMGVLVRPLRECPRWRGDEIAEALDELLGLDQARIYAIKTPQPVVVAMPIPQGVFASCECGENDHPVERVEVWATGFLTAYEAALQQWEKIVSAIRP